jgi:hypothetical protein
MFADTSLPDLHLLCVLMSLIFQTDHYAKLWPLLKRRILPAMSAALTIDNFLVRIFLFEILSPVLARVPWYADDFTPDLHDTLRHFSALCATDITAWEKLPLQREKGLVLAVLTQLLLSDVLASSVTPESPPADIAALYDHYMDVFLASQETPIAEMERWICLCFALGSDLPIPIRFPRFLIVSAWASYGITSVEDRKAEFVKNYAIFLRDSDFLANHWEIRFDEELGQLITKAPVIDSRSPIDISAEPFQTLRIIGNFHPRLLWCRLQLFNQFSRYLNKLVKSIATAGKSEP